MTGNCRIVFLAWGVLVLAMASLAATLSGALQALHGERTWWFAVWLDHRLPPIEFSR